MGNQQDRQLSDDLSLDDYRYLMKQTHLTPHVIQGWYREFTRVCPTGQLTKDQFAKFYKQLSNSSTKNVESISANVFRAFDHDGRSNDNGIHLGFTSRTSLSLSRDKETGGLISRSFLLPMLWRRTASPWINYTTHFLSSTKINPSPSSRKRWSTYWTNFSLSRVTRSPTRRQITWPMISSAHSMSTKINRCHAKSLSTAVWRTMRFAEFSHLFEPPNKRRENVYTLLCVVFTSIVACREYRSDELRELPLHLNTIYLLRWASYGRFTLPDTRAGTSTRRIEFPCLVQEFKRRALRTIASSSFGSFMLLCISG